MGILLVFTLCVCLPRSFSQSVTQTPATVSKKECQSLTITCVYNGGFWARPLNRGDFFRQTQPGTKRERISSGGRFVVSMNKAEKTFSLEIEDVRVKDTATYYCKAEYSGVTVVYYDSVDGSGTVVTVTADSTSLVSQSPPLQTSAAGDTVTLRYEYSGFCQYTVLWYRQSPGQAPKYLLQIHTSGEENKENAAEGRISASIDPTKKISRLKISKLQLSDSAVYYCELSRRTAQKNRNEEYFLNGAKLGSVAVRKDLGALVHESPKASIQVQQAIKKAIGMLTFIARGFEYRRMPTLKKFRSSLRPLYCSVHSHTIHIARHRLQSSAQERAL
ncbi:uncharacterized protein [Heterodontus francisci]|uniref:uncharacterized protein n=1 Tax=Heterodontus francisci TaxID=7792 RepID=UPI00355AEE85